MASFPGSAISPINAVDNSTTILAAHVNNLYDELANGVEAYIGLNPQIIADAAPSPTPATVAAYLDMVAKQLHDIVGGAAWHTSPGTSLAALNTGRVLVPGGVTTGDILYYNGSVFTRLGIGSAGQLLNVSGGVPAWAAPTAYIPPPGSPANGDLLYYNGSTWARLPIGSSAQTLLVTGGVPTWTSVVASIPAPATPANGDLLYYNGAAWARLPIGAAGQYLQITAGMPAWAANTNVLTLTDGVWTAWDSVNQRVNIKFRKPVVTNNLSGTTTEYSSIQAAVNAGVNAGDIVVIPPGTYNENIVVNPAGLGGLIVQELVPGTVILQAASSATPAVTIDNSCTVSIATVLTGTGVGQQTVPAILIGNGNFYAQNVAVSILPANCIEITGVADVKVGLLNAYGDATHQAIYVHGGIATVECKNVYGGVNCTSGSVVIKRTSFVGVNNIKQSGSGVVSLHGVDYSNAPTFTGNITYLNGDTVVAWINPLGTTGGTIGLTMQATAVAITPNAATTFNVSSTVAQPGASCSFIITTSGASSYVLTWGTGFKTTGTLATGTATAKTFTISFIFDGTNWCETGRTGAM